MSLGLMLLEVKDATSEYAGLKSDLLAIINTYVIPCLCTAGIVVLAVFLIINAIRYGKSEDGEPKTKAKKQLIGTAIGIIILFAAIWLLPIALDFLIALFGTSNVIPGNA